MHKQETIVRPFKTTRFHKGLIRSKRGSGFLLTLVACAGLILLALAVIAAFRIYTCFVEFTGATSAGTLNVAKQMISSVGVTLLPEEATEFGDLVDKDGLITLRSYNAVVARAVITVLNAEEIGSPEAIAEAKAVADMAQCGDNSIGKRLHDAVEDAASQRDMSQSLAESNARQAVRGIAQIDQDCSQSFLYSGSASNVYIDYRFINQDEVDRLAALNALTTEPDGKTYLKGYTTIDLGYGCVFQLMPLRPGTEPHLVSDGAFERNKETLYNDNLPEHLIGKVPPNCYRTVCQAQLLDFSDKRNGRDAKKNRAKRDIPMLLSHSNAVVGPLDNTFPAAFATAYQPQGHARKFYFPTR